MKYLRLSLLIVVEIDLKLLNMTGKLLCQLFAVGLCDLLDIFGGLFQLGALEFYHFPRRLDLFGDAVNHARVDLVVLSLEFLC